MRWHHRLYVALRGMLAPTALERELDEELQFHLDRQTQANIDAGMTPEQARRSAALLVGNPEPIREQSRDGRAGAVLRQIGRDMSYGARLLSKASGFSLSAIAIVALGIASVTTIFSVVYGVALRPLPFREPDRLVNIRTVSTTGAAGRYFVNAADHRDWLAQSRVFEDIAVQRNIANYNLIGDGGEPERLLAARISANLLPVLGVSPALGRNFTEDEDEIGGDDKVLLSDAFWRRRFNADPAIVGRSINLSGVQHTVVGVMAPGFQYPDREFQIWTPLTINPRELARTDPNSSLLAIGRLKPGVTLEAAQADMNLIASRLAAIHDTNRERGWVVIPTHADLIANIRTGLYVMLAASLCLLLVAVLNLSALVSARAASRQRELAVRLALGASRGRVAMQTVAEITPLLAIGGVLGVAAAVWAVNWFAPLAPLPRAESIQVDATVLAASLVILTLAGVVASLAPASQAWRSDMTSATRDGGRAVAGSARQTRARRLLVATQIALTLPLLTAAVLLTRTFDALTSVDPGFRAEGALSIHLAIPRSKYRNDAAIAEVTNRISERAAQVPGVTAVGLVNRLPLSGTGATMTLEFDAPAASRDTLETVDLRVATAGYFAAMGIPLIEGRAFDDRDTASAPPAAIIDQRIASLMWPGESAIGKRMRVPLVLTNNKPTPWFEIVGVVGHVLHDSLDLDPRPQIYWHAEQRPQDRMVLVARSTGDATSLTPMLRQAIREIDPEQPLYDVRTMQQVVDRSLGQRWLSMTLILAFALSALLLCAIGVYGVIAFGVARQRREFGIRLALGASRGGIASSVVQSGVFMATIGIVAGLALSAALARAMTSMLYGIDATDSVSYATAVIAIVTIVLLSSYLPARAAAAVEPAITLRAE